MFAIFILFSLSLGVEQDFKVGYSCLLLLNNNDLLRQFLDHIQALFGAFTFVYRLKNAQLWYLFECY